jgi:hypothetical protein
MENISWVQVFFKSTGGLESRAQVEGGGHDWFGSPLCEAVGVGLGRIVALHHRLSSAFYQICQHTPPIRCSISERTMRPNTRSAAGRSAARTSTRRGRPGPSSQPTAATEQVDHIGPKPALNTKSPIVYKQNCWGSNQDNIMVLRHDRTFCAENGLCIGTVAVGGTRECALSVALGALRGHSLETLHEPEHCEGQIL